MTRFGMFGLTCGAALFASTAAFALPKATTLVEPMGMGYNIGNTMEVPENPTAWGNPLPTAAYIKAIKNAGFNTVRIPCAWYSHSDALAKDIAANGGKADNNSYTHVGKASDFTTPTIDAAWLKQVKDVVDMIIAEGMYVVLNSHWDEGWLEDRVYDGTATPRSGANNIANSSATTKARQAAFWTQIATYFKVARTVQPPWWHRCRQSCNVWSGRCRTSSTPTVAVARLHSRPQAKRQPMRVCQNVTHPHSLTTKRKSHERTV